MLAERQGPVRRRPVLFIRGITPRCGTNYLRDLLLLHPEFHHAREPVWEDFALDDADKLAAYTSSLVRRWPASWSIDARGRSEALLRGFGDAVVAALIQGDGPAESGTTLAKTPSVAGLEHFRRLFPDDPLVLLVRDGRDVVQSLMRSFGWSFERAVLTWASAGRRIDAFREVHAAEEGTGWLFLRYEDVLDDPIATIRAVAALAHLTELTIDLETVASLPVRGSSSFGQQDGPVHWRPVVPDASFQPRQRWRGWSKERRRRFAWVAGDVMRSFGYELDTPPPEGVTAAARHRSMDAVAAVGAGTRALRARLRHRVRLALPLPSGAAPTQQQDEETAG